MIVLTPQAALSDTINSTKSPPSNTQSLQLTSQQHSNSCTRNVLISTSTPSARAVAPATTQPENASALMVLRAVAAAARLARMPRCLIKSVPKVANVTADTLDTTATRAFALLVTTPPVTVARTPLETCNLL